MCVCLNDHQSDNYRLPHFLSACLSYSRNPLGRPPTHAVAVTNGSYDTVSTSHVDYYVLKSLCRSYTDVPWRKCLLHTHNAKMGRTQLLILTSYCCQPFQIKNCSSENKQLYTLLIRYRYFWDTRYLQLHTNLNVLKRAQQKKSPYLLRLNQINIFRAATEKYGI